MPYYAHSNEQDKTNWQTILEHLENTAELTRSLGDDSGVAAFAYAAALLHDIGKYSPEFQQRLEGKDIKVDHSTAGAREIDQLFSNPPSRRIFGKILAYCIAGHHGGLPDYGSPIDLDTDSTLNGRLKRQVKDYQAYSSEIDVARLAVPDRIPIRPIQGSVGFSLSFFTRMVYSTLVDADFLETETFMNGGKKPRGEYEDIPALAERFAAFLTRFDQSQGAINQRRTETMKACIARAEEAPGLFTLTLPTGGGKTFTSMGFALQHALKHDLKRIIYVIPYTSIIEQNAAQFKKSLGQETILEHHSNFDWNPARQAADQDGGNGYGGSALAKLKWAAENWDIPVVVTTSVQFFESLYANRSSRCRKIHNLAKSVILFDEAQMLPREYLKPCLYAVVELVKNYGASAVFCTATQPSIEKFLPEGIMLKELIDDPRGQFNFYKRVRVIKRGKLPDADLLQEFNQHNQALCIVNTRKHARGLFSGLQEEGRFHLSTLMCAAHRSAVITEIRERLKTGLPCRVVSTQLLEAGVDLDFPVGYRALAGLESIIQAGGRVNREGKQPSSDLFVFEPVSEYVKRTPAYIRQTAEVARLILERYPDPVCMEAVEAYYMELYNLQDPAAFDNKKILSCFPTAAEPAFDFQTAAERFKLIENDTVAVIIPYDQAAEALLGKLGNTDFPLPVARALQPYTVNIFEPEYQALLNAGVIDIYCDRFAVLKKREYYDDETGLTIPDNQGGQAIFTDF